MEFSVAIVGNDGSGKTTIAKRLLNTHAISARYLYMGLSTLSSNKALPTSKLARLLKIREYKNHRGHSLKDVETENQASHGLHHGGPQRGSLWRFVRLLNRLFESLWRQFLSWIYQYQGYVVLYDRHYLFETAAKPGKDLMKMHWMDRFEYKFFRNYFPKPGLVIFLDAPSEVLLQRKGESKMKTLEKRRARIIEMGRHVSDFIIVDAQQPLGQVYEDVLNQIITFKKSHRC